MMEGEVREERQEKGCEGGEEKYNTKLRRKREDMKEVDEGEEEYGRLDR